MRILVVEDDALLAEGLLRALGQPSYVVDHVRSAENATTALAADGYDLLILDIGLPGIDGFELLRRLRATGEPVPVLILTARDAIEDRVRGLDLGADDYLVKPFAIAEFEARVRTLLRRRSGQRSSRLATGRLTFDSAARRAWIGGEPIEFTAREWALLDLLTARAGRVLSKEQIIQAAGSFDADIRPNAIEVLMSRLRAKVEGAEVNIRTVRGFGYVWDTPVDDA